MRIVLGSRRRTKWDQKAANFATVTALIALLAACNARVDGCLDIEAANFDVTVDRNDASTCTYPDLLLDVIYRWGDTTFSTSAFYENSFGQSLQIPTLHVIFSQFTLTGVEFGRLAVSDRTEWYLGQPGKGEFISVPNDFIYVDRSRFVFPAGEWRRSDFMESFAFTIGVPDSLTPTVVDSLEDGNKLVEGRLLYIPERARFANARFVIARDTGVAAMDTVHLSDRPISLKYALNKQFRPGRDDTVRVLIDFKELFFDVDLRQDSSMVASELSKRLEAAIVNAN